MRVRRRGPAQRSTRQVLRLHRVVPGPRARRNARRARRSRPGGARAWICTPGPFRRLLAAPTVLARPWPSRAAPAVAPGRRGLTRDPPRIPRRPRRRHRPAHPAAPRAEGRPARSPPAPAHRREHQEPRVEAPPDPARRPRSRARPPAQEALPRRGPPARAPGAPRRRRRRLAPAARQGLPLLRLPARKARQAGGSRTGHAQDRTDRKGGDGVSRDASATMP